MNFLDPMGMGIGMGTILKNGYGYGYGSTRLVPAPRPSLVDARRQGFLRWSVIAEGGRMVVPWRDCGPAVIRVEEEEESNERGSRGTYRGRVWLGLGEGKEKAESMECLANIDKITYGLFSLTWPIRYIPPILPRVILCLFV